MFAFEIIIATLLFFSVPGHAEYLTYEEHQKKIHEDMFKGTLLSREKLLQYQQPGYKIVDPIGDLALITLSQDMTGQLCSWVFTDQNYHTYMEKRESKEIDQCKLSPNECNPQAIEQYKEYLRTQQKGVCVHSEEKPINEIELINTIQNIFKTEYLNTKITPTRGIPHDWSGEFMKSSHDGILPGPITVGMPKLILALAIGVSSRFMIVGKEEDLIKLILQQPVDSITLEWMFEKSYHLNRGNVYNSLLTIENILSKHLMNKDRETLPVTKRLKNFSKDIDCPSDRFGMWYHFWGTVLYGYYDQDRSGFYKADSMGDLENFLAALFSSPRSPQKKWVNLQGASIGKELKIKVKAMESAKAY
ncbi:MAG: hypothetical protein ACXVCR_12210 [Bdellovibrio sp.]